MKLSDFDIGTVFQTSTWHHWRCTDVGRRTILAIELNPDLDEAWLAGPPFIVQEVVFDEIEMERAFRSTDEAISQSLKALDDKTRPGTPLKQPGLCSELNLRVLHASIHENGCS